MVLQLNQPESEEKESIKELEKEISVLRSLGIEDYEIKYLVF